MKSDVGVSMTLIVCFIIANSVASLELPATHHYETVVTNVCFPLRMGVGNSGLS